MAHFTAEWRVSLTTDCPKCGKTVDLLDSPDFWDTHGSSFEIAEHMTEGSRDVEVDCPECLEEFVVDLVY